MECLKGGHSPFFLLMLRLFSTLFLKRKNWAVAQGFCVRINVCCLWAGLHSVSTLNHFHPLTCLSFSLQRSMTLEKTQNGRWSALICISWTSRFFYCCCYCCFELIFVGDFPVGLLHIVGDQLPRHSHEAPSHPGAPLAGRSKMPFLFRAEKTQSLIYLWKQWFSSSCKCTQTSQVEINFGEKAMEKIL